MDASSIMTVLNEHAAEDVLCIETNHPLANTWVLCTARSRTHARTLARKVYESFEKVRAPEGLDYAEWIFIHAQETCVHIFQADARRFYDLEGLWRDMA